MRRWLREWLSVGGAAAFAACAAEAPPHAVPASIAEAGAAPAASNDAAVPPRAACGDDDGRPGLPERVTSSGSTIVLPCDGAAGELALTTFVDGTVRLRYGKDAKGSIVPVERLSDLAPTFGHRGSSVAV
jgi:hypothetical protein